MTDHRDELIETQRKLIDAQSQTIATLRAYLKAAHDAAQRLERALEAVKSQTARKDVQA